MKRIFIGMLCLFVAIGIQGQNTSGAEAYRNGNNYYNQKEYNKAIEWYAKGANLGNADAQNALGDMYFYGRGIIKSYSLAVDWYKKAARQEHASGMDNLGYMYMTGNGVEKNYTESIQYFNKAAGKNNLSAMYHLGYSYKNGFGVQQDYAKAIEWYKKAAEGGSTTAYTALGDMYSEGLGVAKDQSEAVKWYKAAAEKGSSNAQNILGVRYYSGEGITKDYEQAVYWFKKVADSGLAVGQYNLASCYLNGNGIEKNRTTGLYWMQKAADQGYENAKKELRKLNPDFSTMTATELYDLSGEYYLDWRFAEKEDEKKEHLEKYKKAITLAAEKGEVNAQVSLGANYLEGRDGFPTDYAKAKQWMESALKLNNKKGAPNYLGIMYYEGKGVAKDYKKAFNYFTIAANNKVKNSNYYLALCYEHGYGTKRDIPSAIEYYDKAEKHEESLRLKKAHNLLTDDDRYELATTFLNAKQHNDFYACVKGANRNHTGCTFYLAWCYDQGFGVEKDTKQAAELYKSIMDKSNDAKSFLVSIYMDRKGSMYNPEEGIRLLKELEKEEYIWAYNDLGDIYMDGISVPQDEKKGFEYYKKAAENNIAVGMNNLGWAYLFGKGVKRDYGSAMEWFQKAVQTGNATSYIHIGNCYFYGWGVKQDYAEAISNYKKAIADSYYPSYSGYLRMGECYLLGRGVAQDYNQAVQMFEKGQKGNSLANFYLALCYEMGLGVEQNMQKAQEHMRKAEELGYPISIQMKGLDTQGNWSETTPPDEYNYQTIYSLKINSGHSYQKIIITGTTLRNIHQRLLSASYDQSEELSINLPSVFGVEKKQHIAQPVTEPQFMAGQPPKVHILSHSDNMMFNQSPLEMKYFIDTPDEAPLLELLVKINNKLLPTSRGLSFGEPITLNLPEEDCNIVFQARNKYGYGPAEVINLKWDDSKQRRQRPNLYVLAIGIDEYEHMPKLKYAVKDMNDFIEAVENKRLSPYGEIMVKRLPNQMAKRQNIEEGLEWLKEMATDKDFSFVYYAGHGLKDERDRFHFVPIDGKKERMSSTCISAQRFIDDYLSIIAGKVIVFTDACYSGALLEGRRGSASDAFTDDIIKVMMRSNTDIMFYSSTSADTVANELAEESNGAFTKALLEAFNGEGTQQDKRVLTTMDLQNYLRNRVRNLSKDQVPNFRVERDLPLFTY